MTKKATWPTMATATAEVLTTNGRWWQAAAAVLRVTSRFQRDRDEAARTVLTAPVARLTSALIAVSFGDHDTLRAASEKLRQAISNLLPSVATTAAWNRALTKLEDAIGDFRQATDQARTQPPRWQRIRRKPARGQVSKSNAQV